MYLLLLLTLTLLTADAAPCTKKYFGESSFVCVCNGTTCELPGEGPAILPGQFRVTKSSKDEFRLHDEVLNLADNNVVTANVTLTLDTTVQYQSMIGFGGGFTDAAGLNILTLSESAQENLLRAYFGPEGADYTVCRTPIAGTDFSVRPYSYDDVEGDVDLVYWSLAPEDYNYKLPFMRRAFELTTRELSIFGSPWSPPAWMKTNGMFNESGILYPEYWQPWSNYFVKFVQAYEEELGHQLWGLTSQNEPLSGFDPTWGWNTCGWSSEDMRDWIKTSLGPTLEAAGMRRLKLMIHDFNRDTLPYYPETMTSDPECSQYVDGIAVHWYNDSIIEPTVLDETHDQSPDKFMIYTEASAGLILPSDAREQSVVLGSWERGELYMRDIIENCNHWAAGWVEWNLALDMDGGPSWAGNTVGATIIINKDEDEFYIQPIHAAISMFSRNILRDAKKISIMNSDTSGNFQSTAFLNPDGTVVVVVINFIFWNY